MVVGDPALQGRLQGCRGGAEVAGGAGREPHRIRFARDEGIAHRPRPRTAEVTEDLPQLHVRIFQDLLDPQEVARALPHELLAGPREIAQRGWAPVGRSSPG